MQLPEHYKYKGAITAEDVLAGKGLDGSVFHFPVGGHGRLGDRNGSGDQTHQVHRLAMLSDSTHASSAAKNRRKLMNRKTLTRTAITTTIIASVSFLTAGVIGFVSRAAADTFSHAEKGSIPIDEKDSMPTASIRSIRVETLSENITIRECSGESVTARFHGKVSSSAQDDMPHLKVERHGTEMTIRIERHRRNFVAQTSEDAELEVHIPKQYAGNLSAKSVSGNITTGSHRYKKLALTTISGNIESEDVKAESLKLDTTSGNIRTQKLTAERTEIRSTSGEIKVKAATGDMNVHATSGDVAMNFTDMPDCIEVETVSSDIRLGMPSKAKFKLDAHSVSGDLSCDFPITLVDSRADGGNHVLIGVVESDKDTITANTVSGNIKITRNI